ncbi:MAG: DUF1015 domain-containing protein, partial [Oscillospiraceae bacterium]
KDDNFDERIENINKNMTDYLSKNIFDEHKNKYFYIERKLKNGNIRKGIIGMVDLTCYDYEKGSTSLIRATEGTVLDRIPPRVKIRENAPLELPHVMLLIDDEEKAIIEPLENQKSDFLKVYDFSLMQNSGSISGYCVDDKTANLLDEKIIKLSEKEYFEKKYNVNNKSVLQFAVGDGNHSLATARKCFLNLKEKIGDEALNSPARYALVELVNLHDSSLEFEAIHRVVFGIDPACMLLKFAEFYNLSNTFVKDSQEVTVVIGDEIKTVYITNSTRNLSVGSLQDFIDDYLSRNSGEVDYIHGEDVVKKLCKDKNSIGFILPCMDKNDLFKTVILDGALPRKTFSMGEACDKRFYLEARKIQK